MRKIFSLVVIGGMLLAAVTPSAAQHLEPQEKVDSTFNVNFRSIKKKLKRYQPPSPGEAAFAYVLDFMSGNSFFPPVDYSGVPQFTGKGLVAAEKWYHTNKDQIGWPRLQRGLTLINVPSTDEINIELETLKIK